MLQNLIVEIIDTMYTSEHMHISLTSEWKTSESFQWTARQPQFTLKRKLFQEVFPPKHMF